MKFLSIIILAIVLFGCNTNYNSSENIEGNPKLINLEVYSGNYPGENQKPKYQNFESFQILNLSEDGMLTSAEQRNISGDKIGETQYDYDDDSNLVSASVFDADGKDLNREVASKWSKGQMTESKREFPDFTKDYFGTFRAYNSPNYFTVLYSRDRKGKITEEKIIGGKGYEETITYIYNNKGDLWTIESKSIGSNEKITEKSASFEYIKFDEKLNWTRRLKHIDGAKTETHIRKIAYY